ncbi:MAG: 50S ribosomal protein P1 [Euryarchaeota archaeon]|jgi:large subunit ribosomal protein L12|nr:50S ribosomal protein P1 [Euryarchaeota archaeon]
MEYIYSAMVLHSAGKPVTEEGITSVLKAAGVAADKARVKALTAALEGVNIDEAIKSAAMAPVAAAPAAAPADEKKAAKKEEKEEKKVSEEEAAAGLGALFG